MRNIILVGAGGIGRRHLQALAKCEIPLRIKVVDINKEALKKAEEEFRKVENNTVDKIVEFYTDINKGIEKADLGIIATNSDTRKDVIKNLLNQTEVFDLILEKILFQCLEDYEEIMELLDQRNVKAWVNCPRRLIPFYQEIKKSLNNNERIWYTVQGGDWGLASNAIHFIDHLAFFTNETEIEVDKSFLDNNVKESKRKGFLEFTGKLYCHTKNGSELALLSINKSAAPLLITILSNSAFYVVDENTQRAKVAKANNGWRWEEIDFKFYYQSELTNIVVKDIFETGSCWLTSLKESILLHKVMLEAFIQHIEIVTKQKWSFCPIT